MKKIIALLVPSFLITAMIGTPVITAFNSPLSPLPIPEATAKYQEWLERECASDAPDRLWPPNHPSAPPDNWQATAEAVCAKLTPSPAEAAHASPPNEIPEPATIFLLAGGLAALAAYKARRGTE